MLVGTSLVSGAAVCSFRQLEAADRMHSLLAERFLISNVQEVPLLDGPWVRFSASNARADTRCPSRGSAAGISSYR
jgi:hypothetical protein